MNEIRQINKDEIKNVVEVHLYAFKGFFLSELGEKFLKVYYNAIRKNDKGILLGYYENNGLLGFCAATSLSKGFNKHLVRKNIVGFSLIGIKLLFTNPKSIVRLYNNFSKTDASIIDKGYYAELLSIGVSPLLQGKGAGRQLLTTLEEILKKKNIEKLSLTTDYYNNEKALRFYATLGYEVLYEFNAYPDRKMYRLIKNI